MTREPSMHNGNLPVEHKYLGLFAAIAAYTCWGLFPLYFQLVENASATEILSHRIIWSVPFAALLLFARNQWGEVLRALKKPRVLMMLGLAALCISVNWLIYTWAVTNERILEASLGYFINPLMYVVAGVFILHEPLRRMQTIAVAVATFGVVLLTVWQQIFPWIPVSLAALFTAYGYIRKTIDVGALPGLFLEVVMLSPIAMLYLVWLMQSGSAVFGAAGLGENLFLMAFGPLTVIPLTLFAIAARRLRLTTVGFLQYIGPTLQFIIGIILGEIFTFAHAVSFGLIWIALVVFSWDAWRASRIENPL